MFANGTGKALVKTGGDTWFFLTADYTFGHSLEWDTEKIVLENGGKMVGKVRAPIGTSDFSSFLLQAQVSDDREAEFLEGVIEQGRQRTCLETEPHQVGGMAPQSCCEHLRIAGGE